MFHPANLFIVFIFVRVVNPLACHGRKHLWLPSISKANLNLAPPSCFDSYHSPDFNHVGMNNCNLILSTESIEIPSNSEFGSFIADWGLLGKVYTGPDWLGWFDVANLPLPADIHTYLANLPVWGRLVVGLGSLEVVPLAVDFFILYSLWKRVTAAPDDSFNTADLPASYDHERVLQYFMRYPILVVRRTIAILEQCRDLLGELLQDRANGALESNASARAEQLCDVMRQLGPAAIEIGRSLSMRVDLLPAPYTEALCKLQDSTSSNSVILTSDPSTATTGAASTAARGDALLDFFILRTLVDFAAQNIPSWRGRLQEVVKVIDSSCERLLRNELTTGA